MELPTKLQNDIWDYCRVNKITDIDAFTTKMVRDGFAIERFGYKPQVPTPPKKEVEVINAVDETVKVLTQELAKANEALAIATKVKEVKKEPIVVPKPKDIYNEDEPIKGSFGSNLLD